MTTWRLISPGTGGNMHSLALPPDGNTIWVGSDNAGMMRGKKVAAGWLFEGAQHGIASRDISDIYSCGSNDAPLVYAVAPLGIGPGGASDLSALYFRGSDLSWNVVPLWSQTHVWSSSGVPTTAEWSPDLYKPEQQWQTPRIHLHAHSVPPRWTEADRALPEVER